MENLQLLMQGFSIALTPENIIYCIGGGIIGIIVGALPGLGSVAGVALLLPLTFKMNPTTAIISLAALYYGNMFGGAISAILLNIPGDAPAVMTTLDGYSMAKKGRAGQALNISFYSSFIGGLVGAIMLTFAGPALANIGLKFGPPEMAALILLAMTSVGWVLGDNPAKGLLSTVLGLMIASIGVDSMQGTERMTFGILNLAGGIEFIPLVIGMFGFSQVIETITNNDNNEIIKFDKLTYKNSWPNKEEWKRSTPASFIHGVVGFIVGLIPGSGATTAAFMSYIIEKKRSKHPEELGTGAPEGIAAPESSNNAASVGAFAPLVALGIPGSGTTAVLLGGLMMWGLQPGPLFMHNNPEVTWALFASMFTGNVLVAIICILTIPLLVNILTIPNSILAPIIIGISIVGSYSVNNSLFDVSVMIFAGVIGYILMKHDFPTATLVLAAILGPMLETSIRQSFLISQGSISIFFTRPLSLAFIIVTTIMFVLPIIKKLIFRKKLVTQ